jgi:lipopolysaccharide biosynthesis glycosyltransferase
MRRADRLRSRAPIARRLLARITEKTTVRRFARGLAGELLLVDRHGDIVDPRIDPRVFTREPDDLSPERYAHVALLMRGAAYLPGCLAAAAGLRWHVHTRAALVCLVDDSVPGWARAMLERVYDRVVLVPRLRAHDTSFPDDLLCDPYRDMYTKLHIFDSERLPYRRVCFVDADLLPLRRFDHLFTLTPPAAVIENVAPTSQLSWVRNMRAIRHGRPVPPRMLALHSDQDVRGGINGGLLLVEPDRARFEELVRRIEQPMTEWGAHHREHCDRGIRYGFAEQHFLQVEFQDTWTAIDPRFNSMRIAVPHSFGIHWTVGRKPWENRGNPGRTPSQVLWSLVWETLRLYEPHACEELERRGLVRDSPA